MNEQEFAQLEELREQQATEAVETLDAVEEAAVSQTLQVLSSQIASSNSTNGVLAEASVETVAGVLKVVALSAASLPEGSNVSIQGEEGASVSVPTAVLAQAADAAGSEVVLLSFTTLSANVSDKIRSDDSRLARRLAADAAGTDTGSTLVGQSISIEFRTSGGSKLEIKNLAEPMEFLLPVSAENATCAYFDEEALRWSTEGVETIATSSGQVICRTSHLSIFGGVLGFVFGNIVSVLKCSTASQIFSAEGVAKLGQHQWLSHSASMLVFACFFLFAAGFCLAVRLDTKVSNAIPWEHKEPLLLRTKTSVAQTLEPEDNEDVAENAENKSCCTRIWEFLEASAEWLLWGIGLFFGYENLSEVLKEFLPNAPESVVNRCITSIHAHKTGTSRDSIDGVKKMVKSISRTRSFLTETPESGNEQTVSENPETDEERKKPFSRILSRTASNLNTPGMMRKMKSFDPSHSVHLLEYEEIRARGEKAVQSFISSTIMNRIFLLFPSIHPWLETARFSLFTSHATRAALIITKLTSAAAAAALFYSSSSVSPDSDPDCLPPTDLLSSMIQAATVGLVTAFVGDTVVFILFMIQTREAVDKHEWDPLAREKQLRRWKWKSMVFWVIWTSHLCLCMFYTLAFLANVSSEDAAAWLEGCAISLLQDLVIFPLTVALILAIFASLAICCSQKVKQRIDNDWFGAEESEEEQEMEGEKDGAEQENHSWLQPEDVVEVVTPEEDLVVEVSLGLPGDSHVTTFTDAGLRKIAGEASPGVSSTPRPALHVDEGDSCNSISIARV